MQWKSIYKTCSGKYKRIGGGLQAEFLANDGYIFDFYFCNESVDEVWLEKELSLLHCRPIHMFSQLKDNGHKCNMDNLYDSVYREAPEESGGGAGKQGSSAAQWWEKDHGGRPVLLARQQGGLMATPAGEAASRRVALLTRSGVAGRRRPEAGQRGHPG